MSSLSQLLGCVALLALVSGWVNGQYGPDPYLTQGMKINIIKTPIHLQAKPWALQHPTAVNSNTYHTDPNSYFNQQQTGPQQFPQSFDKPRIQNNPSPPYSNAAFGHQFSKASFVETAFQQPGPARSSPGSLRYHYSAALDAQQPQQQVVQQQYQLSPLVPIYNTVTEGDTAGQFFFQPSECLNQYPVQSSNIYA